MKLDLRLPPFPGCSKEPQSREKSWTRLRLRGKHVFLGQIPLILPDIHIVKLGSVAGLYLDLLSCFSAGVDPVTLEGDEDRIEAAFFDSVPAFQAPNHLPVRLKGLLGTCKTREDKRCWSWTDLFHDSGVPHSP
jgi:hypothetical protein